MERRLKPRIEGSFPAVVCGTDTDGNPFEMETMLDNLSASGLHVHITRHVGREADLSFLIRIPVASRAGNLGMRFKAEGTVTRVTNLSESEWELGVEFRRYHQVRSS